MKGVINKKLISIVGGILAISILCCFILIGINLPENKKESSPVTAVKYNGTEVSAYTIESFYDDDAWLWNNNTAYKNLLSNYDSYEYFNIKNPGALITLLYACDYAHDRNTIMGKDFTGKTVFLSDDIAFPASEASEYPTTARWFCGTFDGCGHYIDYGDLNQLILQQNASELSSRGVLFDILSETGTIKNLQIMDFNVRSYGPVGGVVGWNNGIIDSCIVSGSNDGEGFHFKAQNGSCDVAPFAVENLRLSNCLVKGLYTLETEGDVGINAYHFVVHETKYYEATNSIFVAEVKKTNESVKIYTPSEKNSSAFNSGNNNFNSAQTAYNSMPSSVATTVVGPSGSVWYKCSYGPVMSGMAIYLRVFLDWFEFYFDCDGNGSYERTSYCPSTYIGEEWENIENQLTSSTISLLFDTPVISNPPGGYAHLEWEQDGEYFKATFIASDIDIYFSLSTNTTAFYSTDGGINYNPISSYYTTSIGNNEQVRITYENYPKPNSYKICYFKFTNANNQNIVVKYVVDSAYIINGNNLTQNSYINITSSTPNKGDIRVTTELKSYGIEVG